MLGCKTVSMESKFIILILSFLLLPSSQSRPLEMSNFDSNRTRSLHRSPSSSSAVVRVISSSSSSSSTVTGHGGHTYHRTINHQVPLTPTTPSSLNTFQPTTYHPQWSPAIQPQKYFQQHTFQRPALELRQPGFHFLNRSPPPPPLPEHTTDFFSFFTPHTTNVKSRTESPTLEPIVSVVSSSHTVSEGSESATTGEQRVSYRKSINQEDAEHFKVHKRRIVTRVEYPTNQHRRSDDALDSDTFMFQGDQPQQPPITTTETPKSNWEHVEKVWGEPEKVWGEPEKVWGEPEKVWGTTERNWEEQWEPQKQLPEAPEEIPTDAAEPHFYELGEDEGDEPKELVLDKSAMEAKLETAQLAARSWELPELSHHMSLVPPQSLVRSSSTSDGMTAESIQIPFRTNALMPKVHLTLEGGGAKAKSIPAETGYETTKVQFQEGGSPGKKFGYVLDGNNVRKYRVEERTPDGYIVGEYGVLNHNNGFLRGVRYTADGSINPRLIHEALMKFLSL